VPSVRRSEDRDLRLDGIRGIAVLLVLLYHTPSPFNLVPAHSQLLRGGWIGVDVFFVLSGYLITGLLLAEQTATGSIDRRAFYGRRARRLLPAFAVLFSAWLVVTLSGLLPVEQLGTPPLPATSHLAFMPLIGAVGLYNWVLALGAPSPVGMVHLWTLSVEEQFYFIWPTVIVLVTARARRPQQLLWILVVTGAFVSIALSISAVGGHGRDFAYFSSLTRSFGLFVGAALAIAKPRHRSVWLGVAAVAVLGGLAVLAPDDQPGLLPWAILLTCGAAAVLIASAETRLDGGLTWSWLRYAGRRSYAIYLWCLPLNYALGAWLGISWQTDLIFLLSTFGIAELSWRVVERRFLFHPPKGAARARPRPGSPVPDPASA
jgi:peptidoglycan/LPS O-acetylase OafA/YrhL